MTKDPRDTDVLPAASLPGEPTVELEAEVAESGGREEGRLLLLVLVVAACVALFHLTPLKQYVTVQEWKSQLRAAGAWAPVLFFIGSAVLIAMGVPRLTLCMVAGTLFGFVEGSTLSQFSSLVGSYSTFVFARWSGREWVAQRVRQRQKLRDLLRNPSTLDVFLVRQLPIAGVVPNLLFGITPVRHRTFLIGSFLGYLPSTIIVASAGSGLGKASLLHSLGQVSFALLGLCVVSLVVWRLRRHLKR